MSRNLIELMKKKQKVEIDFGGVICTPALFLNCAFARVFERFQNEEFNSLVGLENETSTTRHILENIQELAAKRKSKKFEKSFNEITINLGPSNKNLSRAVSEEPALFKRRQKCLD